jgi:hypothetical protein
MTERALPAAERVLPAIALPVPRARTTNPGVVARPVARPAGTHRGQPWFTTPARAGMLIGASAAMYAVSLAGVSALQASSDAALDAQRQPYVATVAEARAANDRLEAALRQVDRDTRSLVAAYATTGDELAAYQGRLDALAALVADVQGSAASLPTRLSLPKVSVHTTSVGSAPRTTTKTSASGR